MSLWKRHGTAEEMTARMQGCLPGLLGIRVTALRPDALCAEMPVDSRHAQPWGLLHGGCSVVLAETLGTAACVMALPEGFRAVGIEVNANHVAGVPIGQTVTAECRPLHVGRSTQVWQTEIRRADGRLACVSRLTCQVLGPEAPAMRGSHDRPISDPEP
jgi:1,4-dihydroxy-2-naphthoyl-CoA hydrolase